MSTLPVSVRLAVWCTAAFAGRLPLDRAVERATPDLDDVAGVGAAMTTWRELGERVVLPALPGPGDLGGLPRNDGALTAAAVETGECVFVPGVGAALVPALEVYGPPNDEGWSLRLHPYACEPVPRHRLEMASVRDADRELRAALSDATTRLTALGATWGGDQRALADAALTSSAWGLPNGLDAATTQVMTQAATVEAIVSLAHEAPDPSLTAATADERERVLRSLGRAAERALEQAATVACLQVAGWLPSR